MLILCVIALERRSSPLALSFAAVTACAALWDFAFAAEIINPSLEGKIFWANVQFLGITYLPVAWLALTLHATGQPRQAMRSLPVLTGVAAIINLLIWSNPYHHLFRGTPTLLTNDVPFPVLANDYGPLFYAVHVPIGYFLFAISLFLLITSYEKTTHLYRQQRIILIFALLAPLLTDLLYVAGITPIPSFNFTPVVFSLSGLLISWNILHLRFLDILPLAYEAAINEMKTGVIVLNAVGRTVYLNPVAENILNVPRDQAIGQDARKSLTPLQPLWKAKNNRAEIIIARNGEESIYQAHRTEMVKIRRTIGQIITLHDVTERARLLQQVEELSLTDALTGALNRRALEQLGVQEIQRARRYQHDLALILLDVDNFKSVNDTLGHQAGDKTLTAIMNTLRQQLRTNDFIFRFGGDEFIALLPEIGLSDALTAAQRILKAVSSLVAGGNTATPIRLSISLGVAALRPGDTLEELLKRADQALYRAKEGGKNQVIATS